MKKYAVDPSPEEKRELEEVISKGKTSARRVKRANILLMASEGKRDEDIVEALRTSRSTVIRTRQRFVEGNLEFALSERVRVGRPRKLSGKAEAMLTAVACSAPPEGRSRWTLRLLAKRMVQVKEVGPISRETVRRRLKKTNSSRG